MNSSYDYQFPLGLTSRVKRVFCTENISCVINKCEQNKSMFIVLSLKFVCLLFDYANYSCSMLVLIRRSCVCCVDELDNMVL